MLYNLLSHLFLLQNNCDFQILNEWLKDGLANLKQVAQKEQYNKSNDIRKVKNWCKVKKNMIKKHQKLLICATYQRTSKQLLKETFEPFKENRNIEWKPSDFNDKLLTFKYWYNQMKKLIAAVKTFLPAWLR